jgi:hypothetical protein
MEECDMRITASRLKKIIMQEMRSMGDHMMDDHMMDEPEAATALPFEIDFNNYPDLYDFIDNWHILQDQPGNEIDWTNMEDGVLKVVDTPEGLNRKMAWVEKSISDRIDNMPSGYEEDDERIMRQLEEMMDDVSKLAPARQRFGR